jgi:hypothetical protein
MKHKVGQWFFIASGILMLLGGGSCYLVINNYPLLHQLTGFGDLFFIFSGLIELILAFILGVIGLILINLRREQTQADLEKK